MAILQLDGLSVIKLSLTVFLWASILLTVVYFVKQYGYLKNNIPRLPFIFIWLLLLWNFLSIAKSIYFDTGSMVTLFGNTATALALLMPFTMVFSIKNVRIVLLNKYLINLLKLGIVVFLLLFVFTAGNFQLTHTRVLAILLLPAAFLITFINFQNRNNTIIIIVCAVLAIFIGFIQGNRTTVIRELLLFCSLIIMYICNRFGQKWMLKAAFLFLIVPFFLLVKSVNTGESAIQRYLAESSDTELNIDTRTFLYVELFEDLVSNNQLLFGKGANGKYYSAYFSEIEGDAENRLDVEVGVLAMLLKGGIISVFLNIIIFILAIFYAFFRSRNSYLIGAGFVLLIHTTLLFIENIISYSNYNLMIWFFVGICLSKKLRCMTNMEIQELFYLKKSNDIRNTFS